MANIKPKSQNNFQLVANSETSVDFNKLKIGNTSLANDVFMDFPIDWISGQKRRKYNQEIIAKAIDNHDIKSLRAISNYYYDKSGIYSRLCRYMSNLYRYDWYIIPEVQYNANVKSDSILKNWQLACNYLDECKLKRTFSQIALKVIKQGCYYGYKMIQPTAAYIQELPVDYCRSRFSVNGKPAVEFNIKFFDDTFNDAAYRLRVLKMFPKEVQKAYVSYKQGTLPKDFNGDDSGWFVLDPAMTVKFNLSGSDAPLFVSIIPHLIDLEDAQDIDKQKMKQQLLRLIIQQFPLDKNGDLIFDVDEMNTLHRNAVAMLGDAIGVDVLSTLANVQVADLSDRSNVSSVDQLEKVERTVYNEAGVSQRQFNTDGNLALEKSIANDEAALTDLILQFEDYIQDLLDIIYNKNRKIKYKAHILYTTVYNYKELAKLYKEQTMIGFSKLLPQVALGHTQSSIIATALFENQYMNLDEVFIAPQMSSTRSDGDKASISEDDNSQSSSDSTGGRPELPDEEKSEKTLQNLESES